MELAGGKWYKIKNCLRPSELLDIIGRHLDFTLFIGRMTEVLASDISVAYCSYINKPEDDVINAQNRLNSTIWGLITLFLLEMLLIPN